MSVAVQPKRQPQKQARRKPGEKAAHLKVVESKPALLRSPSFGFFTFAVVFAGLLGVVLFHSVVVSGQLQLDHLTTNLKAEQTRANELRVEVAQLEAPDRILQEAAKLGMVFPPQEAYIDGFPLGVEPLLPPGPDPFSLADFDPALTSTVPDESPGTP